NTSIAAVPTASQEAQFLFTETTANHQAVSIQGTLTYRIAEPVDVASRLDFTIDPSSGRFRSDDPEKLLQRVVNAVQAQARSRINDLSLEEALTSVRNLATEVFSDVAGEPAIAAL